MTANSSIQPNWSDLQTELLQLIFRRLNFVDTVRVRAVCHSWNTAVRSIPLPGTLWIMYSRFSLDQQTKRLQIIGGFFSLGEDKFYKASKCMFREDEFGGVYEDQDVWGSTQGWIVLHDERKKAPTLLNPFTGRQIQLPPMNESRISFSIFVLSSDPCLSKDYAVVATYYQEGHRMSFYKPGDNTWTTVMLETHYTRIACNNNQIFGLRFMSQIVDVWDLSSAATKAPVVTVDVEELQVHTKYNIIKGEYLCIHRYLVESLGEVLLVHRATRRRNLLEYQTIEITVLKLDYSEKKWMPIQTLPAGRAILIKEEGGSTCVSIGDFPGLEENSIYYLETDCMGIYNLKDKQSRRIECEKWNPNELCHPSLVVRNTGGL